MSQCVASQACTEKIFKSFQKGQDRFLKLVRKYGWEVCKKEIRERVLHHVTYMSYLIGLVSIGLTAVNYSLFKLPWDRLIKPDC